MKFHAELIDPFGTVTASGELIMAPEVLTIGAITQGLPGKIFAEARDMTNEELAELAEHVTGREGEFLQRRPVNARLPYRLRLSRG